MWVRRVTSLTHELPSTARHHDMPPAVCTSTPCKLPQPRSNNPCKAVAHHPPIESSRSIQPSATLWSYKHRSIDIFRPESSASAPSYHRSQWPPQLQTTSATRPLACSRTPRALSTASCLRRLASAPTTAPPSSRRLGPSSSYALPSIRSRTSTPKLTSSLVLHRRPAAVLVPPRPPLRHLLPLHRRLFARRRARLRPFLDRRGLHGPHARPAPDLLRRRPHLGLGRRKLSRRPVAVQPRAHWKLRGQECGRCEEVADTGWRTRMACKS